MMYYFYFQIFFSGLGQANKIDPETKEKEKCREWLNVCFQ